MDDSSDTLHFERTNRRLSSDDSNFSLCDNIFELVFGTGTEYNYIYDSRSESDSSEKEMSDLSDGSDESESLRGCDSLYVNSLVNRSVSKDLLSSDTVSRQITEVPESIYDFVCHKVGATRADMSCVDMLLRGEFVQFIVFHSECPLSYTDVSFYYYRYLLFLRMSDVVRVRCSGLFNRFYGSKAGKGSGKESRDDGVGGEGEDNTDKRVLREGQGIRYNIQSQVTRDSIKNSADSDYSNGYNINVLDGWMDPRNEPSISSQNTYITAELSQISMFCEEYKQIVQMLLNPKTLHIFISEIVKPDFSFDFLKLLLSSDTLLLGHSLFPKSRYTDDLFMIVVVDYLLSFFKTKENSNYGSERSYNATELMAGYFDNNALIRPDQKDIISVDELSDEQKVFFGFVGVVLSDDFSHICSLDSFSSFVFDALCKVFLTFNEFSVDLNRWLTEGALGGGHKVEDGASGEGGVTTMSPGIAGDSLGSPHPPQHPLRSGHGDTLLSQNTQRVVLSSSLLALSSAPSVITHLESLSLAVDPLFSYKVADFLLASCVFDCDFLLFADFNKLLMILGRLSERAALLRGETGHAAPRNLEVAKPSKMAGSPTKSSELLDIKGGRSSNTPTGGVTTGYAPPLRDILRDAIPLYNFEDIRTNFPEVCAAYLNTPFRTAFTPTNSSIDKTTTDDRGFLYYYVSGDAPTFLSTPAQITAFILLLSLDSFKKEVVNAYVHHHKRILLSRFSGLISHYTAQSLESSLILSSEPNHPKKNDNTEIPTVIENEDDMNDSNGDSHSDQNETGLSEKTPYCTPCYANSGCLYHTNGTFYVFYKTLYQLDNLSSLSALKEEGLKILFIIGTNSYRFKAIIETYLDCYFLNIGGFRFLNDLEEFLALSLIGAYDFAFYLMVDLYYSQGECRYILGQLMREIPSRKSKGSISDTMHGHIGDSMFGFTSEGRDPFSGGSWQSLKIEDKHVHTSGNGNQSHVSGSPSSAHYLTSQLDYSHLRLTKDEIEGAVMEGISNGLAVKGIPIEQFNRMHARLLRIDTKMYKAIKKIRTKGLTEIERAIEKENARNINKQKASTKQKASSKYDQPESSKDINKICNEMIYKIITENKQSSIDALTNKKNLSCILQTNNKPIKPKSNKNTILTYLRTRKDHLEQSQVHPINRMYAEVLLDANYEQGWKELKPILTNIKKLEELDLSTIEKNISVVMGKVKHQLIAHLNNLKRNVDAQESIRSETNNDTQKTNQFGGRRGILGDGGFLDPAFFPEILAVRSRTLINNLSHQGLLENGESRTSPVGLYTGTLGQSQTNPPYMGVHTQSQVGSHPISQTNPLYMGVHTQSQVGSHPISQTNPPYMGVHTQSQVGSHPISQTNPPYMGTPSQFRLISPYPIYQPINHNPPTFTGTIYKITKYNKIVKVTTTTNKKYIKNKTIKIINKCNEIETQKIVKLKERPTEEHVFIPIESDGLLNDEIKITNIKIDPKRMRFVGQTIQKKEFEKHSNFRDVDVVGAVGILRSCQYMVYVVHPDKEQSKEQSSGLEGCSGKEYSCNVNSYNKAIYTSSCIDSFRNPQKLDDLARVLGLAEKVYKINNSSNKFKITTIISKTNNIYWTYNITEIEIKQNNKFNSYNNRDNKMSNDDIWGNNSGNDDNQSEFNNTNDTWGSEHNSGNSNMWGNENNSSNNQTWNDNDNVQPGNNSDGANTWGNETDNFQNSIQDTPSIKTIFTYQGEKFNKLETLIYQKITKPINKLKKIKNHSKFNENKKELMKKINNSQNKIEYGFYTNKLKENSIIFVYGNRNKIKHCCIHIKGISLEYNGWEFNELNEFILKMKEER